jgi:hypothetical protein
MRFDLNMTLSRAFVLAGCGLIKLNSILFNLLKPSGNFTYDQV